jgi:hypothetical protein
MAGRGTDIILGTGVVRCSRCIIRSTSKPDPNDKPAEKLLERIKAARTKHLAEAKAASKSKKNTPTKQIRLV